MKRIIKPNTKLKKIGISILTLTALFSVVGCSKKEGDALKDEVSQNTEIYYDEEFEKLECKYNAKLGVYALDTETNTEIAYNAEERFAYCSTFKALAAGAILEKYSIEDLDKVIQFSQEEVLSHAPVAKYKVSTGMTIEEICEAAVRQSDNTAANLQFDLIDGPEGFKKSLNNLGDSVTEPSRKETELNEATPGDIRDTSTPKQLAIDLKEYATGEVLSKEKQKIFIDWMSNNATGDELIRAGAPKDWVVADKSGAGSYGTRNDIAIVMPPNRKPIFIVVMSKKDGKDEEYNNKLIEEASKIVFNNLKNGEDSVIENTRALARKELEAFLPDGDINIYINDVEKDNETNVVSGEGTCIHKNDLGVSEYTDFKIVYDGYEGISSFIFGEAKLY